MFDHLLIYKLALQTKCSNVHWLLYTSISLPAQLRLIGGPVDYQCHRHYNSGSSSNSHHVLSLWFGTAHEIRCSNRYTTYYPRSAQPRSDYNSVDLLTTPVSEYSNFDSLCALLLNWGFNSFAIVIYVPTSKTSPAPATLSKRVAVLLWALHILLFIISVVVGGRPQDMFFNIIRNINAAIINPLFTVITMAAFFFQARLMSSVDQLNAWSQWKLGFQLFTFLLLATSWPFRLILPPNMWQLGSQPALLLEWYCGFTGNS